VDLTCGRTFARGYRLQQPSAQRHRGLTADGLAIRADGSSQVSGIGKIGPWPRPSQNGRMAPFVNICCFVRSWPTWTGSPIVALCEPHEGDLVPLLARDLSSCTRATRLEES
jgi:hypothetical protein